MTRLIETVRVRDGAVPLWPLHMARLRRSAGALGIPKPELECPEGGDRVVRFEVGSDGVSITERPVPLVSPVALISSEVPHPGYPHKTTDRRAFEAAFAECQGQHADDALLLARGGLVAESTLWTIFWWDEDQVAAPPMSLGILASVARARIEQLVGPVVEQRIGTIGAVLRPLFAANAVRGVVPVEELDGIRLPADSRTDELTRRFWG
jgi:branched-subunit amino acid aminotransferase/4-amino-4-deoxychorismate lyase